MDWSGEGMILGSTRFGETSAIVDVFCAEQGRWSGLVRGGASRRLAPHLQAGTQVGVVWRARLENHLGNFQIEPLKSRATLMNDTVSLSAFSSLCALLRFGTPERLAMGRLYENTLALVDRLERGADWQKNGKAQVARYIVWEVGLLQALGYGLDLSCCALSGVTTDLAYVSPKTGRAVERSAAEPWKERLLPLPAFFISGEAGKMGEDIGEDISSADILAGLDLSGHFLHHFLAVAMGNKPLPAARGRFVEMMKRLAKND